MHELLGYQENLPSSSILILSVKVNDFRTPLEMVPGYTTENFDHSLSLSSFWWRIKQTWEK